MNSDLSNQDLKLGETTFAEFSDEILEPDFSARDIKVNEQPQDKLQEEPLQHFWSHLQQDRDWRDLPWGDPGEGWVFGREDWSEVEYMLRKQDYSHLSASSSGTRGQHKSDNEQVTGRDDSHSCDNDRDV